MGVCVRMSPVKKSVLRFDTWLFDFCTAPNQHKESSLSLETIVSQKARVLEYMEGVGVAHADEILLSTGAHSTTLTRLCAQGKVHRVEQNGAATGYYCSPSAEFSHSAKIEALTRKRQGEVVVCLETAASMLGIIDHPVGEIQVFIPRQSRPPKRLPGLPIQFYRTEPALLDESDIANGITEFENEGHHFKITTPARTVCDLFKYRRILPPELPLTALRNSIETGRCDSNEIMEIAENIRVYSTVGPYLGCAAHRP